MGPINWPPIPTAWRDRPASPLAKRQVGLELVNHTKQDGSPLIYWADSYADCHKLAAQDGWKL